MAAQHPEIVIVRRRGSHEDEHHGGAWKIAFADFMTAMMAFFLVLWIISATDKNTKTLIARYFNPVKVEEPAKAQKGIHGVPEKDAYRRARVRPRPTPRSLRPSAANLPGDRPTRAPPEDRRTKAINGARQSRSRLSRRRTRPSPTRPCRSRNCSAILAPVSTRSPARRRRGLASINRRRSRAMAKLGRAPTRRCAIHSVRSAATRPVNVVTSNPGAPPAAQPPPATNRLPCRRRSRRRPRRRRSPSRRRRARSPAPSSTFRPRPTPPRRAGPPHPTCLPI